ncbi:MAG: OPT family oligopeptide transporter [Myxococcota bacterium]|nr:OPT family oligopeptide transporter [Myxococcota bacterium]
MSNRDTNQPNNKQDASVIGSLNLDEHVQNSKSQSLLDYVTPGVPIKTVITATKDTVTAENVGQDESIIYTPAKNELQLTARAVITGTAMGAVVSAMNIYFGLRTGWSIGGSLIAAILSFAFFQVVKPKNKFTPLETNIAQTSGSAAGSMTSTAGLLACIPAMTMLGYELTTLELYLWAGSVAWLGVFFAVPLRRQMVLMEKLRFPTGTATANTIMAMFASGVDAMQKARVLIWFALGAAIFTLTKHFVPALEMPPLDQWLPIAALGTAGAYGFKLLISPMMLGAGVLIGMRVAASLMAGAFVSWAIIAPFVESQGWVSGPTMSYGSGARGWILWVGVAIMVADALTQLAMSWKTILATFKPSAPTGEALADTSTDGIPNSWWIVGLATASLVTISTAYYVFEISPFMTIIAIGLSSILAAIAVRSTGETDINPVGGMGKVTQLVYGGIAPGQLATNLMAAGITGAGASQAGDMMQDLKTGHMLGASPRKQLIAQLLGITGGIIICVPIYKLFTSAYEVGGKDLPAPAAHAWRAMAELLSKGLDAMPSFALYGVIAGLLFGIAMPLLRKAKPEAKWIPSGLAFGIAFIIPAFYCLSMFIGTVIFKSWEKRSPKVAAGLGFAIASGLIAGEGLMGVVNSILTLLGIGGGH